MNKKLVTIFLIAVLLIFVFGCESRQISNADEGAQNIVHPKKNIQHSIDAALIKKIQAFSANQTDVLFAGSGNICYSPLSLYHGLSMLACGADNHFLDEILDVLGVDDLSAHNQQMCELYQTLYNQSEQHNFVIADAIWLQTGMDFSDSLKNDIAEFYFGAVNHVNFSNAKETAQTISQWISDNTNGMLKPEVVVYSDDTIAMLVNSLYLSDLWQAEFDERLTAQDIFYLPGNRTTTAEYMQMTEYAYPYLADDQAVYVSLPLKNIGEMVFILPNEDIDIEGMSISACMDSFLNHAGPERTADVMSIKIPHISMESDLMLIDYLETLGINFRNKDKNRMVSELDADDDGAEYANLDAVSEIRQGTALELNEYGIKAAAYTSIRVDSAPYEGDGVMEFHLNRPFAFMLLSPDKIPVLVGKVVAPS